MTDELFSLKDEFSKMTGIRTPKELRSVCQEAINSISALSLPISSIDNPVVTCITLIFTKHQDKYAKNLVPYICDCIIAHVFSSHALSSITTSLLLVLNDCVEWSTVHKLANFLQTSVLEDFPDISVVQSYFSIVLQLMAHKNENISNVSYAAFQSMIDILIEAVLSYNKPEIPNDFLAICTDIFGMKSNQFEKPLYFILFLIFNDLSCISVGQKMRFLTCQVVPKKVIFDVLEMILRDYIDLFRMCPQLGSVFESTVIQSMGDYDSLPFITAFINSCFETNSSLCSSLFLEFLEKWKSDNIASLFFFYSIFLFNEGKMPFYLIENNNFDGLTIVANLFKKIAETFDFKKVPEAALEFSLKPKTFKRINQEKTFSQTAPIEIVISSINSFIQFFINNKKSRKIINESSESIESEQNKEETNKEETNKEETNKEETNKEETNKEETNKEETNKEETNKEETNKEETNKEETNKEEQNKEEINKDEQNKEEINKDEQNKKEVNSDENCKLNDKVEIIFDRFDQLFQYTANDLKDLLIYGLTYSTLSSFDIVSKSFIKFLSESLIKFKDLEVLISFDVLSDSQKMNQTERDNFSIQEKKLRWDQVLNRIVNDCPQIFASNWYLLFASLFAVSEETVNLSPSFARNFDDKETKKVLKSLMNVRPFPHQFINDFLISNIEIFDLLWPILDSFFDEEIGKSSRIDDKIFELFIDMILKAFVSKTERQLLELGTKILKSTRSVSIDKKLIVLKNLRNVFAEQSQELKNGYPFLFEILDPEMYDNELLTIAFQMFGVICNDYIHSADPIYVRPCLELVFKYAQQTKDINISLSSFDLIWNVVKTMEKNDDNWTHFLFKLSDLFFDERNDVAHCAIKTFSTYLTSNYQQISKETINYFIDKGFVSIINRFDVKNSNSWPALQQTLYELIHFFVTFWNDFNLSNDYIDIYIKKNEDLIMNCTVNDLIVNSYQFYDCLVGSGIVNNDLNKIVVESLTRLADNKLSKIENINSSVVSQFGRTIGNILKSFPKRLSETGETFSENDSLVFKSYLQLIEHISLTFRVEKYVHIATQRILDAVSYVIPFVPLQEAEECMNVFKNVYSKDNEKLKITICEEMEDAYLTTNRQISSDNNDKNEKSEKNENSTNENETNENEEMGDRRAWIVIQSKDQILSEYGEKFAKLIVSKKENWGKKENNNEIKELFVAIKEKYSDLASDADARINELE